MEQDLRTEGGREGPMPGCPPGGGGTGGGRPSPAETLPRPLLCSHLLEPLNKVLALSVRC